MADETPAPVEDGTASSLTNGKTAKELERTVLLGRGKSHLNHLGNKMFQDLIVASVDAYAKEPSVFVKRQMTLKIVEEIEQQGGFLRWSNKNGGGWETIDLEERRQKVAHALQYRIRCMNNTNGGKRARAAAVKAAKNGSVPVDSPATKKSKIVSIPFLQLHSPPQGTPELVAVTAPPPPVADVPTVVVEVASGGNAEAQSETGLKNDAAAASPPPQDADVTPKPKAKTTDAVIQLTEDERSFVRSFVNNPAGPTDSEEEQDNSSPAAVAATAAQLAAVTAAADTVLVPVLPVVLTESATTAPTPPATDVPLENAPSATDDVSTAVAQTQQVESLPEKATTATTDSSRVETADAAKGSDVKNEKEISGETVESTTAAVDI